MRYEYRCSACGVVFAVELETDFFVDEDGMEKRPLQPCPRCDRPSGRYFGHEGPYGGINVSGMSSGPGSGSNEIIFDRPDMVKEGEIILKRMEESGKFRNNKPLQQAMHKKLARLKANPPQKLDYGKDGHPIDRSPGS